VSIQAESQNVIKTLTREAMNEIMEKRKNCRIYFQSHSFDEVNERVNVICFFFFVRQIQTFE